MIYLFDRSESLVRVLKPGQVMSAIQKRERTGMRSLSVTLPLHLDNGLKVADLLKEASLVGHYDVDERFQLYYIANIRGNMEHRITAVHISHDELSSEAIIRDVKFREALPDSTLGRILQDTRWEPGIIEVEQPANYNLYYTPPAEALEKYEERHRAELDYRVEFDGQRITGRYIDAYERLGKDTGLRFVHGHNALSIEREEVREIYTALIGRGKGEEIFDDSGESTGGYGRRIGFEGITWTYPDKRIKPVGQDYVEIPEMTALYGHSDGRPRMRVEVFEEIENPYELIEATYNRLIELSRPQVLYSGAVADVGNARLGDTVAIIRKDLGIAYKTRVEVEERDLHNDRLSKLQIGDWGYFQEDKKYSKVEKGLNELENSVEDVASQAKTKIEQTDEYVRISAKNAEKYTDERFGEVSREMAAQFEVTAESITGAVTESKEYTDSRELIIMDALQAAEDRWEGDLSPIGAKVTDLEGNVSTIVDDLGTLDSDLETLRGDVVAITENYDSQFTQLSNRITLEVSGAREYSETQAGLAQDAAQKYADAEVGKVQTTLGELSGSVSDLDTYIDGAFTDNMAQLSERKAIEQNLKDIAAQKSRLDGEYSTLHGNPDLPAAQKNDLATKKSAFDSAHANLDSTIRDVIRDGLVFPHEAEAVNEAFASYSTALNALGSSLSQASAALAGKFAADAEKNATDYTDGEIGTVRSEASASFDVLAGRINAKADSSTVTSLGTRTYNLEQDMNAVEGAITNTVKYTDYTGQEIISRVNQTASSWKVQAKNIDMEGITTVNGVLNVGNGDGTAKELRFPLDRYGYAANIRGELAGGLSGMSLNASDIHILASNNITIGSSSNADVTARGNWNFTGSVTGITAVAVLG
ncbi:phage tail spike protein [Bhargavaea ginsengi]|uniref:phage tail spike protein n=1 Tax=Bhargavaea ginsengi TaxID=426757 RepID=UPI003C720F38